VHATAVPILNS